MLFYLLLKILLISADLNGSDIGFGIDVISVFCRADPFIEGVKWNQLIGLVFLVIAPSIYQLYVIVIPKADLCLICHAQGAGMKTENIAVIQQLFGILQRDHFCVGDLLISDGGIVAFCFVDYEAMIGQNIGTDNITFVVFIIFKINFNVIG